MEFPLLRDVFTTLTVPLFIEGRAQRAEGVPSGARSMKLLFFAYTLPNVYTHRFGVTLVNDSHLCALSISHLQEYRLSPSTSVTRHLVTIISRCLGNSRARRALVYKGFFEILALQFSSSTKAFPPCLCGLCTVPL